MYTNLVAMPQIVEYRTVIARRRVTSLVADVLIYTPYFHLFLCSRPSHDVVSWSCEYDYNRAQTSRQTIIVKSYDLVRLSYDGRIMLY